MIDLRAASYPIPSRLSAGYQPNATRFSVRVVGESGQSGQFNISLDISLVISYSLVDGSIDQITTTEIGSQASTIGDSSSPAVKWDLDISCKAASQQFFHELNQELGLKTRRRV